MGLTMNVTLLDSMRDVRESIATLQLIVSLKYAKQADLA